MNWDKEARRLIPPVIWEQYPEQADALNAAIADFGKQVRKDALKCLRQLLDDDIDFPEFHSRANKLLSD